MSEHPRPILLFEAVPRDGIPPLDRRSESFQRLFQAFNDYFVTKPFQEWELRDKLFECCNLFDEALENPAMDPCCSRTLERVRVIAPGLAGRIVIMANRVGAAFRAAFGKPYEALGFCRLSSADWIAPGCRAGWIYHSAVSMAKLFDPDRIRIARFLYEEVVVVWRGELAR